MAFDHETRRLQSRIFTAVFLRYAVIALTCWTFAWAAVALALRAAGWAAPEQLLWGLAGAGPCLIAAARLAGHAAPRTEQVLAAMDRSSAAGGLVIASGQADIGPWRSTVGPLAPLHCRWRGRPWWLALGAAGVLVAVALLLPRGMLRGPDAHALDVNRQVSRLTAQIETLEQEDIIEPEQAETLQAKLDRLRAEASGTDPVKTWESLDHVEQTVRDTAAEAAENIAAQKQKLETGKALADALAKATGAKGRKPGETATEAMKALSEMTRQAAAENEAVAEKMAESLREAAENGQLSAEQLKELSEALTPGETSGQDGQLSEEQLRELSEALGQAGDELAETLKQLAEAGLVDGLSPEQPPEELDVEGLIDFLEDNAGDGSIAELVEAWRREGPGRGGVNRGPGDADMTWSDPSSAEGAKYKAQALSPAAVAALKKNLLAGVSVGAPGKGEPRTSDGGGALSGAAAGGGSAHTHVILPRHRSTVRKYFARPSPAGRIEN